MIINKIGMRLLNDQLQWPIKDLDGNIIFYKNVMKSSDSSNAAIVVHYLDGDINLDHPLVSGMIEYYNLKQGEK